MRTILLIIATAISAGFCYFSGLFLNGKIAAIPYTLCTCSLFILMTFAAFHFIYLYCRNRQRKQETNKS